MKLLHYMEEREGDCIKEYVVLTEEKVTRKLISGFCRPGYVLRGGHDVEATNGSLPLDRELTPRV